MRRLNNSPLYPENAVPLASSSGKKANAAATATLAKGGADSVVYLAGFTITGAGATAAAVVEVTVTGVVGGTLTYEYGAVAGAALMNAPLTQRFDPPLPAADADTDIVVSCPALGAGALANSANAWGYRV